MKSISLDGQVAVVTGGGSGIGRTIALTLAEAGAAIAIVGRNDDALADAAAEIGALGRPCLPVKADLTSASDAMGMARAIADRLGPPRIVVTAAGQRDATDRPVADTDPDVFEALLRSNVMSTLLPIRALLPAMTAAGTGRIIAISGVYGLRGRPRHAAGSSAKWAIEGLVRSLALEAGPAGITVNAICPGYVDGPRAEAGMAAMAARRGVDAASIRAEIEGATALRRLSTAQDVAHAALFLASDWARTITGQDIVVDAGWSL